MRVEPDLARDIARLIATIRILIGIAAVLAPRRAAQVLLRDRPSVGTTTLMRMFGGREIALGLGTVLAGRRDSAALRGWVEAGALIDAGDVLALLADRGRGVRGLLRLAASAGAVGATVAALAVSRSLPSSR